MRHVDAYDSRIVETLQIMLAPGGRMRLSPIIEEAQLIALWNERIDHRRRYESISEIIQRHSADIDALAERYVNFLAGRGQRYSQENYEDEQVRQSWLIHNFPMNVCKVQLSLLELVKHRQLSGCINVIDIGIGVGNAAIAVFDFLVAWHNLCMLYNTEFPVDEVQYVGYDYLHGWLETTRRVLDSYKQSLESRLQRLQAVNPESSRASFLERVAQWIAQSRLEQLDLNCQIPEAPEQPTLLIACNVLSELNDSGKANLMHLLARLPDRSCAIIIEPGDQHRSPVLFRWRREFIQQNAKWAVVAPCGQEMGRTLPECCKNCWNLRRDSFHQTQLYTQFRQVTDRLHQDRRSWDEYENNLLSQSYTILSNTLPEVQDGSLELRHDPRSNRIGGKSRYIGHYSSAQSNEKFIKLCPATLAGGHRYNSVLLKLNAETVLPKLNFGDAIELEDGYADDNFGGLTINLPECSEDPVRLLNGSVSRTSLEDGFLSDYTDHTREAIDEIAYRFFGFEGMREFQHEVLRRVLCGKSVFAIAATGGGKSECFILPALLLPGITIVVAPLKSLMQDQYKQRLSCRYGVGDLATYINSDISFEQREKRLQCMIKGYYKIVYFTPEQLERDYILAALREAHKQVGIRYIALDEAHCISQWGHDFRPAYLNLVHRLRNAGIDTPVRIALTATASPKVREDVCRELLLDPRPTSDGGDLYIYSSNRPELNFIIKVCRTTDEKIDDVLRRIRQLDPQREAAIIFLPQTGNNPEQIRYESFSENQGRLSSGVSYFASYLERAIGTRVCIYHSKMEDDEQTNLSEEAVENDSRELGDLRGRTRSSEQDRFIRGECHIMVATKGFGMGIDKPNIRLVLHRTPPSNLEAYIQEAGRAGRDGDFANVVLYYSPDQPQEDNLRKPERSDREIQELFINQKYIRREDVEAVCQFLRGATRRANNAIYFTNDELIEFLDNSGFSWPDLPERQRYHDQTKEHEIILDRGHDYYSKTLHIRKILSSLYTFRPHGRALVNRVQEAGIKIVGLQIVDADAIIRSNAYFGRRLREAGVNSGELESLLKRAQSDQEGLIPFAKRLGCSLYEAQAMLRDIKRITHPDERPALLDFSAIVAPRYGPAEGKDSLQAWREYAGAFRRASLQQAEQNAERRNNNAQAIREISRQYNASKDRRQQFVIRSQISDDFYRVIGSRAKRYMDTGVVEEFNIPCVGQVLRGRFDTTLPDHAHVLYFRDVIDQKLREKPHIRRDYDSRRNASHYEAAQQVLVRGNICSLFEAKFYTNPKIRIVALDDAGQQPMLLVFTALPGAAPSLDDWFPWEVCNKNVGWEVELGEVFSGTEQDLREFIDAFMQEHDQRKQDDWNSYNYLLNDYVGIENNQSGCLRAVMLGYLKTNEIVVGKNCFSCSRCVPDENFSTDLEQRKSVVHRLRQEIIDIINEIEQRYVESFANDQMLQQLWQLVEREEQQGRNVHSYLQGWSGRILTDTPEHKTVHLLRLEAMRLGYWNLRTEEYIQHLRRLQSLCTIEEIRQITDLFEYIRQIEPSNSEVLELMVAFYRQLGESHRELSELKRLVNIRPSFEYFARIVTLIETLNTEDRQALNEYSLQAARLAPKAEQAMGYYQRTHILNNNDTVLEEVVTLLDMPPRQTQKAILLLFTCLVSDERFSVANAVDLGRRFVQIKNSYNLGQEETSQVFGRLYEIICRQIDAATQEQIRDALEVIFASESQGLMHDFLRSTIAFITNEKTMLYILEAFDFHDESTLDILSNLTQSPYATVRSKTFATLARIARDSAYAILEQGLADEDPAIRLQVFDLLVQCDRGDAIVSALFNDCAQVSERAFEYLTTTQNAQHIALAFRTCWSLLQRDLVEEQQASTQPVQEERLSVSHRFMQFIRVLFGGRR
ncbi:MAG: hypothetical protein KatS3mg019_1055 [Fimbriimonadales bacterium]|nr:MAG: hypothetical protein KatS3mg019_1055 [Fimbriimonadales bacterium]